MMDEINNEEQVQKHGPDQMGNGEKEENSSKPSEGEQGLPLEKLTKEDLIQKIKELEETGKKYLDLYARSQAEMENMRKRLKREKEEFFKFANEALIKELLPVVDNLEKAISHAQDENNVHALREGLELTLKGMKKVLEKAGVKEVKALGEKFDPNYHEAVSQQEKNDVDSGTVLQELQKGYLLNQRLIRPAMVVVSKNPDSESGSNH